MLLCWHYTVFMSVYSIHNTCLSEFAGEFFCETQAWLLDRDIDATRLQDSLAVLWCNRSSMGGLIMYGLLSSLKGSNLTSRAKPLFTQGWRKEKSLIQSVGRRSRLARIMLRFLFRQQGGLPPQPVAYWSMWLPLDAVF